MGKSTQSVAARGFRAYSLIFAEHLRHLFIRAIPAVRRPLVMPSSSAESRAMLRTLKQRGYVVQAGAIESLLGGFAGLRREFHTMSEFLTQILDAVDRSARTSMLTAEVVDDAVNYLEADMLRSTGKTTASLEVIDVFGLGPPKSIAREDTTLLADVQHSAHCGSVPLSTMGSATGFINAKPQAKAHVFRNRYRLVLEKILRNPKFSPPVSNILHGSSFTSRSAYLQLTTIDSLLGTHGDRLVMGMLTQMEEGQWFLEDLNGCVRVDLCHARATAGLHTDSSFVIAQGRVDHSAEDEQGACSPVFRVTALGTPPIESREVSIQALGRDSNLFGGNYDPLNLDSLLKVEQDAADAMFLIISDVFLDSPRVLSGLRTVLEGYHDDGVIPRAIVLIGNFLSHPFGQNSSDPRVISTGFTELGRTISERMPLIAESSSFVIIPGPTDAGPGNILPRPPMPPMLLEGFKSSLGSSQVYYGTNPCRIRYLTQEIVILRENLLQKMMRNCAMKPDLTDTDHVSEHMVKSVIDQAHLCPLPLSSRPVLWFHDHALWLFPSPHLLVIADKVEGFSYQYGETLGINPGSFGTDLSFCTYTPANRCSQPCTLNPDELDMDVRAFSKG